uniref:SGNH hydrolase-type esterase domain-containing protein n=1 Tax=Labrus bergylta TaxID=56723 RepID=A0A3Q3EF44_9LABR
MFLIISSEDFTDNFICAKCDRINELQEKLIEMHMKLRQMTELNTVLKETSKLQDTFNATVLIGSASLGTQNSALFATTLPVQEPSGSCSTPCPGGRRGGRTEILPPTSSLSPSPASTVVIGDSIVRGLSLTSHGTTAAVHCFPGARVLDLNTLPAVLGKHCNVSTVVAHIGSNDTSQRESEILKEHFKTLISTTGKNIAISGPLPTHCRIAERRWRKTKIEIYKNILVEAIKDYNKAIRKSRQEYFSNLINSNIHNPRHLFRTIDSLLHPTTNNSSVL